MGTDGEEATGDDHDRDPYESKLKPVDDVHDYSALKDVRDGEAGGNPCQTKVIVPSADDDQQDTENMA